MKICYLALREISKAKFDIYKNLDSGITGKAGKLMRFVQHNTDGEGKTRKLDCLWLVRVSRDRHP